MAQAETKKRARGKAAPATGLPRDKQMRGYRDMLLIRRFEEKAGQLYGMGLIGGFCHLYIGQEAVVVGIQMALGEGDEVITSYRDHGHMLARRESWRLGGALEAEQARPPALFGSAVASFLRLSFQSCLSSLLPSSVCPAR